MSTWKCLMQVALLNDVFKVSGNYFSYVSRKDRQRSVLCLRVDGSFWIPGDAENQLLHHTGWFYDSFQPPVRAVAGSLSPMLNCPIVMETCLMGA